MAQEESCARLTQILLISAAYLHALQQAAIGVLSEELRQSREQLDTFVTTLLLSEGQFFGVGAYFWPDAIGTSKSAAP